MNRNRFVLFSILYVLAGLVALGCGTPPTEGDGFGGADVDLSAEAVAAVQAASDAWALTAAESDAEAFASFYTDDAVLVFEQGDDLAGIDAIRGAITEMMADPNFDLAFAADRIEAAASGDLAWEHGTWSMTTTGEDGAPATVGGTYVAVWRKEADGTWKCVADVPVSGAPAEGA
jgi:uncharacterized protein (TIGR02246 family)